MTKDASTVPSQILIAGAGKLAAELLENLPKAIAWPILPWDQRAGIPFGPTIVVHAGSGRELAEITEFCSARRAVLIELATTESIEPGQADFPIIMCPNVNILMLKFMAMLRAHGGWFAGYDVTISESHQATKTSKPGTAVNFADSLGVASEAVNSIRDPLIQAGQLGIPAEFLDRHAYHKIDIHDDGVSISIETKALGPAPYSPGLAQILQAIAGRKLAAKNYDVLELLENGWL